MSLSFSSDSEFIEKLSKVVEANLADESFGVKQLAQKIRMSRTQLHRKIKSINNQSVSQFLREQRLNKAKEMLQQDLGTVSEIGYKVGFGSPSYFIKCFHDYFGYPPGVLLKLPSEASKNSGKISEQNINFQALNSSKTKKGILVKLLAGILGIITIITITVFIYRIVTAQKKSIIREKSIAVLPLKNLGKNVNNQYLADGIMEDILNRLSQIKELKVKSRISSEQYRNPEMSLPEIAKEMNVSYILEGSIISNEEKVRIYVQLIEAENDNHIWSDEYNQDLTDIFEFTSDVSKQIAEELQLALTSDEIEKIQRNYTEDKEAYNLYLLGRYFWHRRTVEDLSKCIKYFNQAIARDSNYSLAYAGLADTYNTLSGDGYYPFDEGILKCREYALKAVSLDYNLAEGHASLGDCLSDYFWEWEQAEKELKLAIELNPNFALAYKYYAEFLRKTGKNKEARFNINKGIELYPQSLPMYQQSAHCYYCEGKYDEALIDFDKILEFQKSSWPYWMKFRIYIHQGKDLEAINALRHFLLFESHEINYNDRLHQIYSESGINGIIRLLIKYFLNKKPIEDHYYIAVLYSILGERELAIEHLEKKYNTWSKFDLSLIKTDPAFVILHDDPGFIALLEKMNLADK